MSAANVVAPGDTLVLHYSVSSPSGATAESTFDGAPVTVTLGQGELAETMERCLIGLTPGERHVFLLEPGQAFGFSDPALVQRIARSEFPANMPVKPGALIEFSLPNGTTLPGLIKEVGQDDIVVDFNHPLSDCPVNFEVEILEIRRPR